MTVDHHPQLAQLPQVDALVRGDALADAASTHGRQRVVSAAREVLERARTRILSGDTPPTRAQLEAQVQAQLAALDHRRLRRVLNATGVVLHTNLGRAPLSAAARAAVADAAGYTTVEYELDTGHRGSRTGPVGDLAAEVCGTPAATVVNNGAAALLLVLAALAGDREVVVSRGELVEIGGSYRLPEIMAAAGTSLVEVGTTNRTRAADYRAAIGEATGLLLKVHHSNFTMTGFTEEATVGELVSLGRAHTVPVVHDLGTGLLRDAPDGPLAGEPSVVGSVRAGADLVVVSGDKLLGGPQAGIIAGREDLIDRCRTHPLARALRIDKLQRAALEATLAAHARDPHPLELPTQTMLHADVTDLEQRTRWMVAELGGQARVVSTRSVVGGGTLPGVELDSYGVALDADDPDALAAALRRGEPPVVARVDAGAVVLDLRTIPPAHDAELVDLVLQARD